MSVINVIGEFITTLSQYVQTYRENRRRVKVCFINFEMKHQQEGLEYVCSPSVNGSSVTPLDELKESILDQLYLEIKGKIFNHEDFKQIKIFISIMDGLIRGNTGCVVIPKGNEYNPFSSLKDIDRFVDLPSECVVKHLILLLIKRQQMSPVFNYISKHIELVESDDMIVNVTMKMDKLNTKIGWTIKGDQLEFTINGENKRVDYCHLNWHKLARGKTPKTLRYGDEHGDYRFITGFYQVPACMLKLK